MSKHDPKITLQQIMTYAQRAQVLCMDRTLDELLADWQATWAFERAMQLLGESVKRLPRELRKHYPAVDWKGIAGMRDNITHGYDSIDYEILWKAVKTQVPGLLMTLNQMLNDLRPFLRKNVPILSRQRRVTHLSCSPDGAQRNPGPQVA